MGWDRPLQGYFLVIQKPSDSQDEAFWRNLDECDEAHPKELTHFLNVLHELNIEIPRGIIMKTKIMHIKLNLSNQLIEKLKTEATKTHLSLNALVTIILEDYFNKPTTNEINKQITVASRENLALLRALTQHVIFNGENSEECKKFKEKYNSSSIEWTERFFNNQKTSVQE